MMRSAPVVLAVLCLLGCSSQPPQPAEAPPSASVVLGSNGLTAADRAQYYHLAEGSELFPLSWLLDMNDPKTGTPFVENLARYGFIDNPEGPLLDEERGIRAPIGITVAERKGTSIKMFGVNCAACHVGQLEYQGRRFRVDGGPNMLDILGFFSDVAEAAKETIRSPRLLWTFLKRRAERAANHDVTAFAAPATNRQAGNVRAMAADVRAFLKEARSFEETSAATDRQDLTRHLESAIASEATGFDRDANRYADALHRTASAAAPAPGTDPVEQATIDHALLTVRLVYSYVHLLERLSGAGQNGTVGGPGRADAFGAAKLVMFGNTAPLTAPASFPYSWGMQRTAWFHWIGNTNSVLQRNIGEALGLGASFDPVTFESTIHFDNLYKMEQFAYKITPPVWPEELFGKIDQDKAARGQQLFNQHCAGCHEAYVPLSADPNLLEYKMLPLEVIRTDPNEARNWGRGTGAAQAPLLQKIADRGTREAESQTGQKYEWNSGRKVGPDWRDTFVTTGLAYPAKNLAGVWATAPFFHNGSTPTLWDVLSPEEKRPAQFPVGHREYDPVKVGYRTDVSGPFTFKASSGITCNPDQTSDGNCNVGHNVGKDLTDDQRWELIEYLKSKR